MSLVNEMRLGKALFSLAQCPSEQRGAQSQKRSQVDLKTHPHIHLPTQQNLAFAGWSVDHYIAHPRPFLLLRWEQTRQDFPCLVQLHRSLQTLGLAGYRLLSCGTSSANLCERF